MAYQSHLDRDNVWRLGRWARWDRQEMELLERFRFTSWTRFDKP